MTELTAAMRCEETPLRGHRSTITRISPIPQSRSETEIRPGLSQSRSPAKIRPRRTQSPISNRRPNPGLALSRRTQRPPANFYNGTSPARPAPPPAKLVPLGVTLTDFVTDFHDRIMITRTRNASERSSNRRARARYMHLESSMKHPLNHGRYRPGRSVSGTGRRRGHVIEQDHAILPSRANAPPQTRTCCTGKRLMTLGRFFGRSWIPRRARGLRRRAWAGNIGQTCGVNRGVWDGADP